VSRRVLVFALKVVVSVGLLWFVLARLTWTEVSEALAAPRWEWLGAALVIYAISAAAGAVQWTWILHKAGLATPSREIRRLYFVGLFFNNFLPANIGGDAYKIVDLGRREGCPGRVFCATLLDRWLGLCALTVLASLTAVGCVVAGIGLPPVVWSLAGVLVLLAAVLAALISRRFTARVPRALRRLRLVTFAQQVETAAREFAVYRRSLPWLVRVFAFSVAVQAVRLAVHLAVAFGLRLDPTPQQALQLAVLVPLLALSLTLPVTVNGIGLRETISNALLVRAGLPANGVVAMEMTAFLVQIAVSLLGGVAWWRRRGPDPTIGEAPAAG